MKEKGQTLIEVLIALACAAIIISAITVVVTTSLSNAQFSKNQNLATKYATEGLEFVRRIRDSDYIAFKAYPNGTYCLAKPLPASLGSPATCSTPNVDNVFIRAAALNDSACGANQIQVAVTVTWTDNKCYTGQYCHSSSLTSCFSTVSPIGTL
jgi:Tfp pilus assembly protein PilV